jgi:hypothetical protein
MISYSYSKGIETGYDFAKDEQAYLKRKKKLEKQGWKVEKIEPPKRSSEGSNQLP